jgi:phage-related protein
MKNKVIFDIVRRSDGTSEVDEFRRSLPEKDRAKLDSVVDAIERFGMVEAYKQQWAKKLRDGICEIRSKQSSDIQRVLYFREIGNKYMLTHGFTKKTDKTPDREIEHAKNVMERYMREAKNELD